MRDMGRAEVDPDPDLVAMDQTNREVCDEEDAEVPRLLGKDWSGSSAFCCDCCPVRARAAHRMGVTTDGSGDRAHRTGRPERQPMTRIRSMV